MKPQDKKAAMAAQREALAWETSRVIELEHSRAVAWRVAAGAGVLALLAVAAVAMLTPLKTVEPYVIRVDNSTGAVETVRALQGDAKPAESVSKYFLNWYVRYREGYSADLFTEYYEAVGLLSTPAEAQRYLARINPKLDTSIAKQLGTTGKARISIKSVSFLQPGIALVRYVRSVERSSDGQPELTHWAATISFGYSRAPMAEKDRAINPLGFQVSDYRVDADTADASGGQQEVAPTQAAPQAAAAPIGPTVQVQALPQGARP
jgi:type IV secretion system protein VirB8